MYVLDDILYLQSLTLFSISMSFLTDETWPPHMVLFLRCSEELGNYNGLYNSVLLHCFSTFPVLVAPEKHEFNSLYISIHGADFLPLLITHVQSDVSPRGRIKADKLMRQKYNTLLFREKCPLPRLWGLSFVGPSLRVYCADVNTDTIVPPLEDHIEEAWNIDILSPAGFAKMKEIVRDVMDAATQLNVVMSVPSGQGSRIPGEWEREDWDEES